MFGGVTLIVLGAYHIIKYDLLGYKPVPPHLWRYGWLLMGFGSCILGALITYLLFKFQMRLWSKTLQSLKPDQE